MYKVKLFSGKTRFFETKKEAEKFARKELKKENFDTLERVKPKKKKMSSGMFNIDFGI